MADEITITLPDGSARSLLDGATAGDLAASIGSRLAKAAVIASVNGIERDLTWALADGDDVAVVVEESDRGLFTLRHSTTHVLAQAVLDLFPGATFAIGPPIEDGFYYDFAVPRPFTPEDLEKIEAEMREVAKADYPFVREVVNRAEDGVCVAHLLRGRGQGRDGRQIGLATRERGRGLVRFVVAAPASENARNRGEESERKKGGEG